MRKFISIILSLVMMLTINSFSFTVCAKTVTKIYSDSSINISENNIVEIPIYINNSENILGFGFEVKYDSKVLQPISVVKGKELTAGSFDDSIGTEKYSNPFRVVWAGADSVKFSGKLFTIKFKASVNKETIVNIIPMSNDIYDSKYNLIDVNELAIKVAPNHSHKYNNGEIKKKPSCISTGIKTYTCIECGAVKTETISKTSHTYKTTTTKATTSNNGSIVTKCTDCGNISSNTIIYYPKTITLSKTSYIYNGKVQKPTVTVKDSKGKKIAASNYTVTYQSGRKNVGKYIVTIKFKGNYSGTVKKTFTIKPKAATLSSVTAKSKSFTARWKKQATQTTGYQIQYSTSSKFTNAKTVTISKNSTTSKKISKLKAKKKYYVRIRTYKTVKVNGKSLKIYSSWSKSKTVTTKK